MEVESVNCQVGWVEVGLVNCQVGWVELGLVNCRVGVGWVEVGLVNGWAMVGWVDGSSVGIVSSSLSPASLDILASRVPYWNKKLSHSLGVGYEAGFSVGL